jgi:tetratricopeptide (TPR) repeat protein
VLAALLLCPPSGTAAETTAAKREPARAQASPDAPGLADAASEERQLRQEQMDEAQAVFKAIPTADAAFALAMVYSEQGDLQAAIRQWQDGLRMPAESARLHKRAEVLADLGDALRIQDQSDLAEQALRESLQLQPRREQSLLRLGQLLYTLDRTEECLAVLEAGQASSSTSQALRGKACQRLGRNEEARKHFEAALKIDPRMAEAFYGLSVVCARLGATADAEAHRLKFTELKAELEAQGRGYRASLNPLRNTRQSLAMTHTTLAWIYQDRGRAEDAERLWQRAASVDLENTASRFHLLMLFQKSGRNAEGLRLCEEMIRAEPANPFHRLSLGNLETRLGNLPAARSAYETAHRLAPNRPETCFALAQCYARSQTNLTEALSLATRAVQISPAAPHLFLHSRLAARTGDRASALASIRRACELDPGNNEYKNWLHTLSREPAANP